MSFMRDRLVLEGQAPGSHLRIKPDECSLKQGHRLLKLVQFAMGL